MFIRVFHLAKFDNNYVVDLKVFGNKHSTDNYNRKFGSEKKAGFVNNAIGKFTYEKGLQAARYSLQESEK